MDDLRSEDIRYRQRRLRQSDGHGWRAMKEAPVGVEHAETPIEVMEIVQNITHQVTATWTKRSFENSYVFRALRAL